METAADIGSIAPRMRLFDLTAELPDARLLGDGEAQVDRVTYRSARAGPGAAFAALRGVHADGHAFAGDAVSRGAGALIVERPLSLGVPELVVPDTRLAAALCAAALAGHPSRQLKVVGITGTNGKTTSAILMRAVLEAAGLPCALVGTIETCVGGRVEAAEHTTPESVDLQEMLARMVAAGDRALAIEVSSHALAQRRVAGVQFAAGLFTNLTRDHLDYHGTMAAYEEAKRGLFLRPTGEGPNPPGAANVDDPAGRRIAADAGLLGYAVDGAADVRPRLLTFTATGFEAEVATPRGPLSIQSRMRGRFNVSNVLGVIAVGEVLGLSHAALAAGIASVSGVPGRMEPIDVGQPFTALVDYAHTPDSLENVLRTARELAGERRLLVVFGCGGDRDTGKRAPMGSLARALADVAVVTSDNPRSEDPGAIIAQILEGATAGGDLVVEPDRRAAIVAAVRQAEPGDVIVVAGKGHERGQEVAGVVTPFDDREVVRAAIMQLSGSPR